MKPFLAFITPIGETGPVDPGYSPPWAQVPPGTIPGAHPSHPIMLPGMPGWGGGGPVDPGYSPPWARPPTGPVDPGYSPPWARPPVGPVDPGYSPPWAQPRPPVDPGYSPPWAQVPGGGGAPPKPGGVPIQLPGQDPTTGGWVYAYVPGYGWMWIKVAPPTSNTPGPTPPTPPVEPPVEPPPA
jgi:hypothetical protein